MRIDMGMVQWIAPVGVVALLSQCLQGREQGVEVQVVLPQSREVRSYLGTIGFYQALREQGVHVDEGSFDLDPRYRARPHLSLAKVTTPLDVDQTLARLIDTLFESHAPADLTIAASIVVSEIADNAIDHGTPSYMVAQTHTGERSSTPGIHVAIADFGTGFQSTLKKYDPPSEVEAIIKAFDMGVTGTQDQRGVGLSEVRRYVDGCPGARLTIVSRTGLVERDNRAFRSDEGEDCGGVLVSAYFPYIGDVTTIPRVS